MGSLGAPFLPVPSASTCRHTISGSIIPSMSITPSGSVTAHAEQGQDTPLCCEGLSVHVPPYIQYPAWKAQSKPRPAMTSVFPSQRLFPQQAGQKGNGGNGTSGCELTAEKCSILQPAETPPNTSLSLDFELFPN